ncbi:MAG: protein kinase [Acidobacteria bacterium]|nr:protein kinase [Acidobacteriota bacterium]
MPLVTGVRLGPYEILAPIGAGGMGEVYRARDTRLNRTVAIKVLPEHLADDPDSRQRFEREARAVSSLNHPHICVLYDIGHQDGVDFLVMECLEGETLAARLAKGPLTVEQALQYGIQIAGALAAAHRSGISHRDLKPGNVMLTRTGAKLLDFGLAKWRAPGAGQSGTGASMLPTISQGLTKIGTILGTFQYMAPEQLEGKETDARADLFAFGSVLYEMVTGRKAFEGQNQASLISAIMTSDPPPISSLQALTPPALDRIVKKCLVKDPDGRWQSAQDLADEIQWIAAGASAIAAGQPGEPAAGRSGRKRERLAWAGACLLLLAVTIQMAVVHYRSRPQPVQTTRSSLPPPPNSSFVPYNFAVSPDGARLAFVAVGPDGKSTLWVRAFSAPAAQQITGAEGAAIPFWSPDSHRVGFFADGKLETVDVAGGAARILCDAPIGRGGTWNRDATIVFSTGPLPGPLYRISATGGVPAPVTKRPQARTQGHFWPAFLPDGKHFLYFANWSSPTDTLGDGIYQGSLDSLEGKRISAELRGNVTFASGHLLYVRDRSLLAQPFDLDRLETTGPAAPIIDQELDKDTAFLQSGYSVSENGVLVFQSVAETPSRLVWFDSSGKELGQLSEASYKDPGLSPDGRFLAVSSDDERNGKRFIRIHDLRRGVSTRLTQGGNDEFPVWSRDGRRITYLTGATSGGAISINEIPADGSGSAQVLVKGAMMIPNGWSPDGHLVFMDMANGLPHLAVYSATDRQSRALTAGPAAEAQFSPDGKWIAYWAPPTFDIFVQPFPGPGGRLQISRAGGNQVRWSRDGTRIFYIQPDKKLMEVSFDPQKGSAGAPRVLFQTRIIAPSFVLFQFDVAPDGRFLINSFPSNNSSPLTLLTGWTAQLKR